MNTEQNTKEPRATQVEREVEKETCTHDTDSYTEYKKIRMNMARNVYEYGREGKCVYLFMRILVYKHIRSNQNNNM